MHLFDGYSLLLKVQLDGAANSATLSHRFLRSQAYQHFEETGRMRWREFGTPVPHRSLGERVAEVAGTILGTMGLSQGVTDNASVNVIPQPCGRVLAVTETVQGTYLVDVATLATLERVEFDDEIKGDLTTAHPSLLPSGELLNFISTVGSGFHIFTCPADQPTKRRRLASIPHRRPLSPSWIHDFPTSSNYTVIPEIPVYFNLPALMGFGSTEHLFLDWAPEEGALLHVVDVHTGQVRQFSTPTFFVFHWVNAFESDDGRYLHLDACVYEDLAVVNDLLLARLRAPEGAAAPQISPAHLRRLTIDLQAPEGAPPPCWVPLQRDESAYGHFVEFPAVRPADRGVKYRHAWAACAVRPTNAANAIARFDIQEGTCQVWHEPGGLVGEPVFVAAPRGAESSAEGVVVAVVNQADGRSALLLLDGSTHAEVARAVLPHGVASGFHGAWLPA